MCVQDSNARTGSQPSLELQNYKGQRKKKKEEENKLDTSCYIYVAKKGKGGALIPPGIEIR